MEEFGVWALNLNTNVVLQARFKPSQIRNMSRGAGFGVIWRFPKIRRTILRVPIIRTIL